MPDETTVCRFRHLLEEHDLGRRLFDEVQRHLAAKGLKVATGTIVDATIINAPSSTKNADKARDPEMHQTKKGNQWYFGMKGHFGVDSRSKLIHAVRATPANVAYSTVLAWRLSNTLGVDFCVEALEEALCRYGSPEIFNTDQGSQFTSDDFTGTLKRHGVMISMDGNGRCMDNIFVERLWRSLNTRRSTFTLI